MTLTGAIHTLVRQFYSAATPENIHGSFVCAVFLYNIETARYVLEFSKERIMETAGFRQFWELDLPLESLSMRRQNTQTGFVNEESFQPFD
jgi:hypothetical protein